jgi:hypothetical protein
MEYFVERIFGFRLTSPVGGTFKSWHFQGFFGFYLKYSDDKTFRKFLCVQFSEEQMET